ncbi:MAG: regulatory protein RecX [Phycisphaerales bacterium JB040]
MGEPELVRFKGKKGPKRPRYVEHADAFDGADGTGSVTGLKALSADAGCVKVYVDRVQVARVSALEVDRLGLARGVAWTGELARRVRQASALYEAERAGIRMLAGRARSAALIERGLRRRGHDAHAIPAAIDRLRDRGFVDDEAYAAGVARSELGRKPAGRRLLEARLRRDGVDGAIIGRVLAEAFADRDERDDAMRLARRQAPALSRHEPEVAERRLVARLARRGFDAETARACARAALLEAGEATP